VSTAAAAVSPGDTWIRTPAAATAVSQSTRACRTLQAMAFFDSEIVQEDAKRLFSD